MSNTAYTKAGRVHTKVHDVVEDDDLVDDYVEVDEEEYEDEYEDERMGLFSTPARAAMMVISILLLFVVAGSVAWLLGSRNIQPSSSINVPPDIAEGPVVGKLAPDFELVDVRTNKTLKLSSLRGKPVFINFWGTWCPPCREEMPAMQRIYDKMGKDVVFLGVSMGPRDDLANVKQFVELNDYTWTFIHDPTQAIMYKYQVNGIPGSYFVDKTGVIRAVHIGGADQATLEDNISQALNPNSNIP